MKTIGLIVLLLTTVLLAACEEKKPYQPPVPRTEPDKAKGVGKMLEQAGHERKEATGN